MAASRPRISIKPILAFVALTLVVGTAPSAFTDVGPWYQSLPKPTFTPPGAVIGAIWTVLFVLIGVASGLMYQQPERGGYFRAYAVNLVLNALWTPIFFALRRPDVALVEIAFLWVSTLGLVLIARRYSTVAAWLLAPYLAWVTFASFLNFCVVTGLFAG